MPVCIRIAPVGENIGGAGPPSAFLSVATPVVDPTCASGLQILTAAEIQANKNQLTMDSTSNPERVADMEALFYMFLVVLISVWAIKRLLDLFSGEGDK